MYTVDDTHAERIECAQADVEAAAAVDIGTAIPKSLMPTGRRLVYNKTANTKDVHECAYVPRINRNNVLTVVLISTLTTIFPASLMIDETKETCIRLALAFEKPKAQQWLISHRNTR